METTHIKQQTRLERVTNLIFRSQITGSILLIAATIVALIWANSRWWESYFKLWETDFMLRLGQHELSLTLHQWVNDALMVLFFLSVGLEIKREILVGKLSSPKKALLPIAAALGGMIVPAIIYALFNYDRAGAGGWGIPMATDIAFALGVMLLLGKRVPVSLKVFITALAIIDDIGAVIVIAVFYSSSIVWAGLWMAVAFLALIFILTRINVRHTGLYILLTACVWLGMMISGIHATITGILVALVVPATSRIHPEEFLHLQYMHLRRLQHSELSRTSMLTDDVQVEAIIGLGQTARDMEPLLVWLEHTLLPYVTYLIVPLFALSNAGIRLEGNLDNLLRNPITLGIIFGLVLGKQIGVTLFTWLAVRLTIADLPEGITWKEIYAASWLTCIGFTMSLFITELAFTSEQMIASAKLGILLASILAGGTGYVVLRTLLDSVHLSAAKMQMTAHA